MAPFIPILCEGLNLHGLCGSCIVFLWTKVAPPPVLHEPIISVFERDQNAQILVTHLREREVGMIFTRKLQGVIAREGGSMMRYFYVNKDFKEELKYKGKSVIGQKINTAFNTLKKYRQSTNKSKSRINDILKELT